MVLKMTKTMRYSHEDFDREPVVITMSFSAELFLSSPTWKSRARATTSSTNLQVLMSSPVLFSGRLEPTQCVSVRILAIIPCCYIVPSQGCRPAQVLTRALMSNPAQIDSKGHPCHRSYGQERRPPPRLRLLIAAHSPSPQVCGAVLPILRAKLTIATGVFIVNDTFEVSLTQNAVFRPQCTGGSSGIVHGAFGDNSTVTDLRTPFYSSTSPQIFAIAVATVISYFLVILIFITPRTFFVGGPGGGAGFLTRRGLSGSSSVIGVGRRPLLQKIAALTVAISMTIATADTFSVAKRQYEEGFMDSDEMVKQVTGGLEIRVVQVISDTFLWLAQVQTLIRLFPRHKEKVTIKWLGFALILLDVVFSSLNNFLVNGTNTRPLKSRDAIPALSYLFELAIGFIYASSIIYYSMSKYRFAFYHAKMRNICLVALLSITSVLIPVVFFVIDVSSPDIAAWGLYIRWVGAAAASVVVWEWVERIEALERDERKDGILGREIYDGDEMLDVTTANGVDWPGRRSRRDSDGGSSSSGNMTGSQDRFGIKKRSLRSRMLFKHLKRKTEAASAMVADTEAMPSAIEQDVSNPVPPAAIATPISRTDTTSAASTVYAVRYHNLQNPSPQILEEGPYEPMILKETSNEFASGNTIIVKDKEYIGTSLGGSHLKARERPPSRPLWAAVSNPFKRKRATPPAEIVGAQMLAGNTNRRSPATLVNPEKWNLRSRIDAFTIIPRHKLRVSRQSGNVDGPLPVTIIPAQPRGTRTWSPDDLAQATDTSKPIPAPSDEENSRTHLQPSGGGEAMEITVVPAPMRGQVTWPAEELHGPWESSILGGRRSDSRPRQEEMPSIGEAAAIEDRHGSNVSTSGALDAGKTVPPHPRRPPSSQSSYADGLDVDPTSSLKQQVPNLALPQQEQIPSPSPRSPSECGQRLPSNEQGIAPGSDVQDMTSAAARSGDAVSTAEFASSGPPV
jgi:PalH/RIM21